MYETTITYDNTNGQFRFDDDIHAAMASWHGEIVGSGQCLESCTREIAFAFEDENDAIKASKAIEGLLGAYFEPAKRITLTDEPEEPTSTNPVIDPDQSRMPRESVSVLASNQRTGHDAKVIFDSYSTRLGWDFSTQADVLLNWCGEDMVERLLQYIQEARQTEDFEEFLADNFRLSPTQTGGG